MQLSIIVTALVTGALVLSLSTQSPATGAGHRTGAFLDGSKEEQIVAQQSDVKLRGLATILLGVSDLARSRAFYVETLGLKVVSEPAEFVFVDAGSATLALTEEITGDKPPVVGTTQLVFAVDDVRAAHKALSERGVAFVHGPRAVSGQQWAAAFRDPDGHLLGVFGPEGKAQKPASTGGAR